MSDTRILQLTLHRRWFDAIASGEKREEYRAQKPFWTRRLAGRTFDAIHFRNGYRKDAPTMLVECLGLSTGQWEGQPCYVLKLGKIFEIHRPAKDGTATPERQKNRDAQAQSAVPHPDADGVPERLHPA